MQDRNSNNNSMMTMEQEQNNLIHNNSKKRSHQEIDDVFNDSEKKIRKYRKLNNGEKSLNKKKHKYELYVIEEQPELFLLEEEEDRMGDLKEALNSLSIIEEETSKIKFQSETSEIQSDFLEEEEQNEQILQISSGELELKLDFFHPIDIKNEIVEDTIFESLSLNSTDLVEQMNLKNANSCISRSFKRQQLQQQQQQVDSIRYYKRQCIYEEQYTNILRQPPQHKSIKFIQPFRDYIMQII